MPEDYPFHLFVSFVGHHDPFDPPAEYASLYENTAVKPFIEDEGQNKPHRIRKRMGELKNVSGEGIAKLRRQYCASITAIDDAVGEIIDALESRGDGENTCIYDRLRSNSL